MEIIDTFLFSEPHESDLLLIKLELEYAAVKHLILIENSYTFQGDYKGYYAKTILAEPRFAKFLDKVIILETDTNLNPDKKGEGDNFERENWQRQQGRLLNDLIKNDDYVMISDVDEMADFSDENRLSSILTILDYYKHNNPIVKIGRMRYWYDFDNRCYLPRLFIPFVRGRELKESDIFWNARHYDSTSFPAGETPLCFEYSYCFRTFDALWRKKQTYSHTGFTQESIRQGLRCNHWMRPPERKEPLGREPYDFFEKVELTEQNSPKYVRQNLDSLRTNIVDSRYRYNRVQDYPQWFPTVDYATTEYISKQFGG